MKRIITNDDACISVSAFSSPQHLWHYLESGHTLLFKEYAGTGIPQDYLSLEENDLELRWNSYTRSIKGLELALMDTADRLIGWRYTSWFGAFEGNEEELHVPYYRMVRAYKDAINIVLKSYFGENRIIEANYIYANFLNDQSTLLACFQYGRLFDWETQFEHRVSKAINPPRDKNPFVHMIDPDTIEGDGFIITRKKSGSSSGARRNYVDIVDIEKITPTLMTLWLDSDFQIEFDQKTLYPACEEDGGIFGTDAYGVDFYAGHITNPQQIIVNLQSKTNAESYQDAMQRVVGVEG